MIWFAARCGCRRSLHRRAGRDGPPGPPGPNGPRSGTDTVSAEELKKVHDLGSKLFFQGGIGLGYPDSTADDYPAVIVRRLEESAEGCRWLLARWAEILNVVDREAAWGDPEIVRFVGLLGKRGIEAHFDPELNSLFHAFDALGHRIGHKFWNDARWVAVGLYRRLRVCALSRDRPATQR